MSYAPGQPPLPPQAQHYQLQINQPVTDKSKRFLNLSGGALAAVMTGILLVCCIGPIAFCFFSPFLAALGGVGEQNQASAVITSCNIDKSEYLSSAHVNFTITNNGKSADSFMVRVETLQTIKLLSCSTRAMALRAT